jgi:hypothetical protein
VPAAAVGAGRAAAERVMTTAKFMRQMGRKGEFKKEVAGFAARWVHGTGDVLRGEGSVVRGSHRVSGRVGGIGWVSGLECMAQLHRVTSEASSPVLG